MLVGLGFGALASFASSAGGKKMRRRSRLVTSSSGFIGSKPLLAGDTTRAHSDDEDR
jgi:hypothetical protein